MKLLAAFIIIGIGLFAEEKASPPQVPSREIQTAIDSRDRKIAELQERIKGLNLKLEGFGAIYNACEGMSRLTVAPEPIPVRPFTPPQEEKK